MMPLALAKSGDVLNIKKVTGRSEIRRHLETLGLTAGEDVRVVSRLAGNVVLIVRGTRIALDHTAANNILV